MLFYCVTHVINTRNNEQILLTIECATIYNINNIKQTEINAQCNKKRVAY